MPAASTAALAVDSSSSKNEVTGNAFIQLLADYIKTNAERLSSVASAASSGSSSWTSSLFLGGSSSGSGAMKPITLTLSLYHLYYILLKIQEAGFADVGDLDVPFAHRNRRPASAALGQLKESSDARSTMSGWTLASSIGSGWWGAATPSSSANPQAILERNLKIIYTAFTLLPSLRLVMRDDVNASSRSTFKGKNKAVQDFAFEEYPGDRMVPLKAFKSLQRLEMEGIDPRTILFTQEWANLKSIQARDCGLEDISDLLHSESEDHPREWPAGLRILDVEHNDITNLDPEDLAGLERLSSFSLRRNLLISVPSALANLTSLRSLDLSENMIDSVLAIYKSLGAISVLNLRSNRISSLCGLERLLSLEVLDLRGNLIEDVSELTRLVPLPHLRDLYVSAGNPFLDDPSSTSTDGWRIDLFNAFLKDANHSHGWSKEHLPSIDGSAPSWNEKRYLVEHAHSGFMQSDKQKGPNGVSSARQDRPSSFAQTENGSMAEPAHVIVSPRQRTRTRNASESSIRSTRVTRNKVVSPPPPVPRLPGESGAFADGEIQKIPEESASVKPKMVKRKHRRVIDLDNTKTASNDQSSSSKQDLEERRRHERSVSSPGIPAKAKSSDSPTASHRSHHTIATPSKVRTATSRNMNSDTFRAPLEEDAHEAKTAAPADGAKDSGSEADEFRKKMEKLREEVGVENWLSVYASASSGNSRSASPANLVRQPSGRKDTETRG